MKYIKLFESIESMEGSFYNLFGTLVYIDDVDIFGSEWRINMIEEDGQKKDYVGSRSDILSDFDKTNKEFIVKKHTPKSNIPKKKKPQNQTQTYDIVYYEGSKKMETIRTNLEKKLAYGLSGKFRKDPNYRRGIIKVEVNK